MFKPHPFQHSDFQLSLHGLGNKTFPVYQNKILWFQFFCIPNHNCKERGNPWKIIIIIIIIIIMFVKGQAFFLFLKPQSGAGPSISSSVVQRSFFLPFCISVPVLVFYLYPSSVRVVATFSGTVLFPLLRSVLPFSPNTLILFFIQFCYS